MKYQKKLSKGGRILKIRLILIFGLTILACVSNRKIIIGTYQYVNSFGGDSFFELTINKDYTYSARFKNLHQRGNSFGTWKELENGNIILNDNKKFLNNFKVKEINSELDGHYTFTTRDDEGYPIPGATFTIYSNGKRLNFEGNSEGELSLPKDNLVIDSLTIRYVGFKDINYKISPNFFNYDFRFDQLTNEEATYWYFNGEELKLRDGKLYYKDMVLTKMGNGTD